MPSAPPFRKNSGKMPSAPPSRQNSGGSGRRSRSRSTTPSPSHPDFFSHLLRHNPDLLIIDEAEFEEPEAGQFDAYFHNPVHDRPDSPSLDYPGLLDHYEQHQQQHDYQLPEGNDPATAPSDDAQKREPRKLSINPILSPNTPTHRFLNSPSPTHPQHPSAGASRPTSARSVGSLGSLFDFGSSDEFGIEENEVQQQFGSTNPLIALPSTGIALPVMDTIPEREATGERATEADDRPEDVSARVEHLALPVLDESVIDPAMYEYEWPFSPPVPSAPPSPPPPQLQKLDKGQKKQEQQKKKLEQQKKKRDQHKRDMNSEQGQDPQVPSPDGRRPSDENDLDVPRQRPRPLDPQQQYPQQQYPQPQYPQQQYPQQHVSPVAWRQNSGYDPWQGQYGIPNQPWADPWSGYHAQNCPWYPNHPVSPYAAYPPPGAYHPAYHPAGYPPVPSPGYGNSMVRPGGPASPVPDPRYGDSRVRPRGPAPPTAPGYGATHPARLPPRDAPRSSRRQRKKDDESGKYMELTRPLPPWGPDNNRTMFRYTQQGEWESTVKIDVGSLETYVKNIGAQGRELAIWVQHPPSQYSWRYPYPWSSKCRARDCPATNKTILKGFWRVAFDEFPASTGYTRDPFHNAGYMHLFCLEKMVDVASLEEYGLKPDTRHYLEEGNNPMRLNRDYDKVLLAYDRWMGLHRRPQAEGPEIRRATPRAPENAHLWCALTVMHTEQQPPSRIRMRSRRDGNSIDKHGGNVDRYYAAERKLKQARKNLRGQLKGEAAGEEDDAASLGEGDEDNPIELDSVFDE